jgi:hypothetical protein
MDRLPPGFALCEGLTACLDEVETSITEICLLFELYSGNSTMLTASRVAMHSCGAGVSPAVFGPIVELQNRRRDASAMMPTSQNYVLISQ